MPIGMPLHETEISEEAHTQVEALSPIGGVAEPLTPIHPFPEDMQDGKVAHTQVGAVRRNWGVASPLAPHPYPSPRGRGENLRKRTEGQNAHPSFSGRLAR
jgi:hypothetical protein